MSGDSQVALRLLRLHAEVDAGAGELARRHGDRLRCRRGCSRCCVDGLTVFQVEAQRIQSRHADLLARGKAHAEGACAFLDEQGACRIYEDRPYVCRTQGLPLRWLEPDESGGGVELRDICPLNDEGGTPLEQLAPEDCWTLGPTESALAELETLGGGSQGRVALRALWRRG